MASTPDRTTLPYRFQVPKHLLSCWPILGTDGGADDPNTSPQATGRAFVSDAETLAVCRLTTRLGEQFGDELVPQCVLNVAEARTRQAWSTLPSDLDS